MSPLEYLVFSSSNISRILMQWLILLGGSRTRWPFALDFCKAKRLCFLVRPLPLLKPTLEVLTSWWLLQLVISSDQLQFSCLVGRCNSLTESNKHLMSGFCVGSIHQVVARLILGYTIRNWQWQFFGVCT